MCQGTFFFMCAEEKQAAAEQTFAFPAPLTSKQPAKQAIERASAGLRVSGQPAHFAGNKARKHGFASERVATILSQRCLCLRDFLHILNTGQTQMNHKFLIKLLLSWNKQ